MNYAPEILERLPTQARAALEIWHESQSNGSEHAVNDTPTTGKEQRGSPQWKGKETSITMTAKE